MSTSPSPLSGKTLIRFENVSKRFGSFIAVDNVSLDIEAGEFFSLLGPSGCGKTTLLRMLAGLETPTEGHILIDGVDMAGIPPNRRPVNMVFQSYAVFPHMNVADNVAYGLKIDKVPKAERDARVAEALALVKLSDFAHRRPDQLSGGQRQRVALARALVKRPKVLLLDEPLSALDAKLRDAMRAELAQIQRDVGVTFVMVTHDQDEALAMASRCALMNRGTLQQVAAPGDLYEYPANRFVADFIGTINLFEGTLSTDEPDHAAVTTAALDAPIHVNHGVTGAPDARVWVGIRPEKIAMTPLDAPRPTGPEALPQANVTSGIIVTSAYLGSVTLYDVETATGTIVKVSSPNGERSANPALPTGTSVWLHWTPTAPVVLVN
ncbi:spermidine/putrescine ABC transporter ATPase subunit [Novosphingobium nitrogenifigens DSM 19370]|uniref:Spermidine/putrescine import ATP-binding protein PotA n=1 Tax=Novosphingobium nitrogenifigens DSM 19370 TaxID=983920 RepID=F1Z7T9_9SPHN|nr:ABC transporter ATP-binding protein [Novosphingobium nitrogenifigens]EGD59286.1 spermidine/putrescine ABC transporter ATPase subunit [Novosphingobium nitrogenifigens DSM 19370]